MIIVNRFNASFEIDNSNSVQRLDNTLSYETTLNNFVTVPDNIGIYNDRANDGFANANSLSASQLSEVNESHSIQLLLLRCKLQLLVMKTLQSKEPSTPLVPTREQMGMPLEKVKLAWPYQRFVELMMKKLSIVFIYLLLVSTVSYADSIRQKSMGNTRVATRSDAAVFQTNPAKLGLVKKAISLFSEDMVVLVQTSFQNIVIY